MKRIKKFALALGLVVLGTAAFAGSASVRAEDNDTIEKGVFIGSVDVGGMTEDEAKAAVNSYVDSLMGTTFTLQGVAGSMEATAADMGVTADVDSAVEQAMIIGHSGNLITRFKEINDLKKENIVINASLSVDKQQTAQLIYNNTDTLNIEAVDNGLVRTNGAFQFVPGSQGQEVDIVNSVYAINDFLSEQWNGSNNTIDLVVEVVEPRGSQEELAKVKDVLGTYTTTYHSSGANRRKNVENGASKINGSILYPGEEFSVYDTVSPFSAQNGYELAGSYLNGTVVETYGGGICQVSTTLYNAVIRAELDVTMRFNHSMIVDYVKASMDAAISSGVKDFHFVNNLDTPVYIEAIAGGGVITFNIYGEETRPSNREVSFESVEVSTTDAETEFKYSEEFELGYYQQEQGAHRGVVAKLYKIVTVDGVEQSRTEFNNSKYSKANRIIVVGIKGASKKDISRIKKAGETGDEAAVKAAIASAQKPDKKKKNDSDDDSDTDDSDDSDDGSSDDSDDGSSDDGSSDDGSDAGDGTDPAAQMVNMVNSVIKYFNY